MGKTNLYALRSMLLRRLVFILAGTALSIGAELQPASSPSDGPATPAVSPLLADAGSPAIAATPKRVVVIPVEGEIASPVLYILRRGLKQAIDDKADAVVLDMKTPGGALDVTFEIMEALGKFPGETVTYVNNEAISAGAFISAMTGEIWFAPDGIIGAAAPVSGTGQDVDATMKMKIVSYLKARLRSISEGKGYRGQVISAMVDSDYELKIEGEVLKAKGELLSLTASESAKNYGDPARALLSAGTAKTMDELLTKKFGAGGFSVKRLEITWSEKLAVFLNKISPILLGLGLLAVFVEFKTPGFGLMGISGFVLLGVVFLSSYVAGLSGHEPILVFTLGLLLVLAELVFFPGVIVAALAGLVMMLGSLVWAMADLWPNEPITVAWSGDVFVGPLQNLGLGLVLAVGLGLALMRFIPNGWFWDRLAVRGVVGGMAQNAGGAPAAAVGLAGLVGQRGVAATALFPSGQVEIDGRRYEASVAVGSIDAGAAVVVRGRTSFGLVVEKADV
jgi:membrane-bound serine protease (ClpP class)